MIEVRTHEEAKAAGFADFNRGPHLCVDIPDGHFTITTRNSQGKQVTMAFLPYKEGGPAQCVDVAYLNSGLPTINNGGTEVPTFEVLAFTVGTTAFDSRKLEPNKKPVIVTLLMEDKEG